MQMDLSIKACLKTVIVKVKEHVSFLMENCMLASGNLIKQKVSDQSRIKMDLCTKERFYKVSLKVKEHTSMLMEMSTLVSGSMV